VGAYSYLQKNTLVSNILNAGRLGIVLGIVAMMLILWNQEYYSYAFLILLAGYFLFFVTMFVFYSTFIRYQDELHSAELLSVAMMIDSAGIATGILISYFLNTALADFLSNILFFITVLFVVAVAFYFNEKTLFPVGDDVSEPLKLSAEKIKLACMQVSVENRLSQRQEEIFTLLAYGHRANDIADMLSLSILTVRTHINQIYTKLGVHSNSELMHLVRDMGLKA
jgi:DNA-binding CsgD family transcriptional regulator